MLIGNRETFDFSKQVTYAPKVKSTFPDLVTGSR